MVDSEDSVSSQGNQIGSTGQWNRGDLALLIRELKPYTKTNFARMMAMAESLLYLKSKNIAGVLVECGVWRGGNIILSRKIDPHRVCWLYDTFTGMTEPGPYDRKRKSTGITALDRWKARGGKWAEASVAEVRAALEKTDTLDDDYLRFIEGPVEETLLDPKNLPDCIALLRLDTDLYDSTKIELEVLYPRLVRRGFLIVDDYGHWLGAKKAVDDYFGPGVDKTMIDKTACLIQKQ